MHAASPGTQGTRARPLLRTLTPDAVNKHRKRHFLRQLNKPVLYPLGCALLGCAALPGAFPARSCSRLSARPPRLRVGMAPAVCPAQRVQVLAARSRARFFPLLFNKDHKYPLSWRFQQSHTHRSCSHQPLRPGARCSCPGKAPAQAGSQGGQAEGTACLWSGSLLSQHPCHP